MHFFDDRKDLASQGLTLQAVFDLSTLPDALKTWLQGAVKDASGYTQLILLGHGGTALWQAMEAAGARGNVWGNAGGDDPVDSFSRKVVTRYLEESPHCRGHRFLFPLEDYAAPLMALGAHAGWHHPSPFMVGINKAWGSWFAYRALVLTDSDFTATKPEVWGSPCVSCADKPCMAACPAGAVAHAGFRAESCFAHRLTPASSCAETCHARTACPVGAQHRYNEVQMRYHYGRSLESLKAYAQDRAKTG